MATNTFTISKDGPCLAKLVSNLFFHRGNREVPVKTMMILEIVSMAAERYNQQVKYVTG